MYVTTFLLSAAKRMKRPAGVKGLYKVVDHRMKKDLRSQRAKEKRSKKSGKKRWWSLHQPKLIYSSMLLWCNLLILKSYQWKHLWTYFNWPARSLMDAKEKTMSWNDMGTLMFTIIVRKLIKNSYKISDLKFDYKLNCNKVFAKSTEYPKHFPSWNFPRDFPRNNHGIINTIEDFWNALKFSRKRTFPDYLFRQRKCLFWFIFYFLSFIFSHTAHWASLTQELGKSLWSLLKLVFFMSSNIPKTGVQVRSSTQTFSWFHLSVDKCPRGVLILCFEVTWFFSRQIRPLS